jgi:RiboL-PSP-HEPN
MADHKNEEIRRILEAFDHNVSLIEKCLHQDLREPAIILTVSTFEAFLRDIFILGKSRWFFHTLDGPIPYMKKPNTRRAIRNYLQKLKLYDKFIQIRYIYSEISPEDPDIMSLHEVLFGEKKENDEKWNEKINFQNLTKHYGANVAYKNFFGIDLMNSLDEESSTSHRMWENLIKLVSERHEIVHKGKVTTFSNDDVHKVLKSLENMKKCLFNKILIMIMNDG